MVTKQWIRLTASDGFDTDAYLIEPGANAQAAIILAQEAFGLNSHILALAEQFAAQGYLVLAPALYDRIGRNLIYAYDDVSSAVTALTENGFDNPISDVMGAIDYLQARGIKKIGIIGYCYGGAVAWLAAAKVPALSCAVSYYGTGILNFPAVKPLCPTIAHWGQQDPTTPAERVAEVAENNPEVTMYWYEANHGFNSDRPQFDRAAAELALQRTVKFFAEHLG
ncbi:dienelactone hydrolase family protein [Halioxenophilus sp. WMMB6]|uniref:dienelactone hydrolase family protein n=1 Tax=Halioxenophilus sp. WMMB6 TaxID=3073815 RepID=UPI00295E47E8|nr:dienelactone hydrolase family protein [Halioxenophilus sp. WMMB6]